MKITDELVLASHNPAKIAELRALLEPFGIKVTSVADLGLEEPEETEDTFVGNAMIKAKFAAEQTGKPSLADDSGFCLEALDGFPGVHTAPYRFSFPSLEECFRDVNTKLASSPNRKANLTCVLSLYFPNGEHQEFHGQVDGEFVYPARGDNGHHFDYVFQPSGYDKTFAELGMSVKNQISHRAKALESFITTCLMPPKVNSL